MNRYALLYDALNDLGFESWLDVLPRQVDEALHPDRNKLIPEWTALIDSLPPCTPSSIDLTSPLVRAGSPGDMNAESLALLETKLRTLIPWRKGPFDLFGKQIDTEWRSDLKWDRLKDHIGSLENKVVLDIGCGNGYHCWRSRGAGAKLVIGIDPMTLYIVQYQAIARYLGDLSVFVVPLRIEDLPESLIGFDTVFSMGVLYHRRSPLDHLIQLRSLLREGGEVVLETLVTEGGKGYALLPEERYAKMRNVWFIPSTSTLVHWMQRCGFKDVRLVDVTATTVEEQRPTSWMDFESLPDFLDPEDASKTIEGYPAPVRAIVIAEK